MFVTCRKKSSRRCAAPPYVIDDDIDRAEPLFNGFDDLHRSFI